LLLKGLEAGFRVGIEIQKEHEEMKAARVPDITHDAADSRFNYYGRWRAGRTAVTINSGAMVEFAYRGNSCVLRFDVEGFTHYPAVFVQVDNGPVAKTTLSRDVGAVAVSPPYNAVPAGQPPFPTVSSRNHLARFWVATNSLYQTPAVGTQWTTLVGGCRFAGAALKGGDLVPLPYGPHQIEFLGDSITQGLRLLYTGVDDDTGLQIPYANWTQLVADMLGMRPVVTGFGGHGLTTSGTSGVPPANEAFPYVYAGAVWNPVVKPRVVVIYHGTNDGVSPQEFESRYTAYLATVRRAYPAARIFAVCPHNKIPYAAAIRSAVRTAADDRILFLDYSSGVISTEETCDGCHLNPGGAVTLAVRLARDIAHFCP
jgi:lysophospholipase L1-like esterase